MPPQRSDITGTSTPKQELAPFGAVLVRFRASAGLTQEQLAARAGLSPAAISALESGKRRSPRFTTVELIADALGLDPQHRHELVAAARSTATSQGEAAAKGKQQHSPTVASDEPASSNTAYHGGIEPDPRGQLAPWIAEPTPLVDRVNELDLIVRSLAAEDVRLLTLVGPAGVGKTRLALAAATRLTSREGADRFPDGVVLVDLTPVRDPAMVPGAIARAFGLMDLGGVPVLERLAEALAKRRQLVVLDNFEQVLPLAAPPLAELLAACPRLALLVTSRMPLRLRREQTLRVAPLPIPDSGAPLPPLEALMALPSVALFIARARAHRADFALEEQDAPLVAQLVTQLDGLPLALELAAARLDVLPLPTLVRRVSDRLHLLASQAADAPERQQSLEAAVGWSYDLLSEPERRLFRCLGVFIGRVSLDAIAAVARIVGDGDPREAREAERWLPRLLSLAEKSLLLPLPARPEELPELGTLAEPSRQLGPADWPSDATGLVIEDESQGAEPAFGMLETVREYAWERLAGAGELTAASRAHACYFLRLAERADPALRGQDQRAWIFRLEREHYNLRTALRWLLDQCNPDNSNPAAEPVAALRLAGALGYFWYVRGYHAEGQRWLAEALDRPPEAVDSAARMGALIAAGPLLMVQAEYARSRAALTEALAIAERRRESVGVAKASTYLGHATVVAGDVAEGTRRLQEAVRRWEVLGDPHWLGETRFYLGYAADVAGNAVAAAAHYRAALEHLGQAGNAQHAGFVHSYFGLIEWRRGELSSAVTHLRAVLRTSLTLRDRWLLSFAAQTTVAIVGSRAPSAQWERLLGAADGLARATGGATFGWEHLPGAERVARLREQLALDGDQGTAYREGRTLPFAQVAALALKLLEDVAEARPE